MGSSASKLPNWDAIGLEAPRTELHGSCWQSLNLDHHLPPTPRALLKCTRQRVYQLDVTIHWTGRDGGTMTGPGHLRPL